MTNDDGTHIWKQNKKEREAHCHRERHLSSSKLLTALCWACRNFQFLKGFKKSCDYSQEEDVYLKGGLVTV